MPPQLKRIGKEKGTRTFSTLAFVVGSVSALTGRPIKPACALTGEVTLHGEVTGVGGLPFKIGAAGKAGRSGKGPRPLFFFFPFFFQTTFLVLVRKARAIAQPELLGNWLHGVAYRVAMKARANAARRSKHEKRATANAFFDPMVEVTSRELRSVVDAELRHLPEKYRAPLVLCYLKGKTNEEAARMLRWPTGSISGRLARARELLRKRLVSRGLASIQG